MSMPFSTPWPQRISAVDNPGSLTVDNERPRKRKKTGGSLACSWPECGRIFGKLEHLQRHERSRESQINVQPTQQN